MYIPTLEITVYCFSRSVIVGEFFNVLRMALCKNEAEHKANNSEFSD